jgi:hypothetical protein
MSDPQDLLYTNQFISENILSNEELTREASYYDRFKNYIDNSTKSDIENYVENNNYETSDINIDKTLDKKWPVNNKKNHYPIFDTYINDISANRYKKEIISKINIDSRNRDYSKYLYPNSFSIEFPKIYTNIKKIEINDIIFPNVIKSVTSYNNNLAWQYPSENYLINANIDLSIIPVPNKSKQISYVSLPNSTYSYNVTDGSGYIPDLDNYLVYQTQIQSGNYTIKTMENIIKATTSHVIHGANLSAENTNIVEQPYVSYPLRLGTPHLFRTNIDPITNVVKFVNRIEEVNVSAIQTFSPYEKDFKQNDMFYYFSSKYSATEEYTLNTKFIYILVPAYNDITYQYYLNINCIYSPNPFPLVITGLENYVGNLDPELINFTEFYDINIYLQNGYTEAELDSISYYQFIDTITFNTYNIDALKPNIKVELSKIYLRFGLRISLGNIGGNNYDPNGRFIKPAVTENIIYSDTLKNIINNYGNSLYLDSISATVVNSSNTADPGTINGTFVNSYNTSGLFSDYKSYIITPLIGRALLYRWIFDKKNGLYVQYESETINQKKRTLLHTLAWPIANDTEYRYTVDINNGYKFVHTNYQPFIIDGESLSTKNLFLRNNIPSLSLNLQKLGNDYYFINNSYVFLKIDFNAGVSNETNEQLVNAIAPQNLQYNQNYVLSTVFNVGIGEDYSCIPDNTNIPIYKRDPRNIFAKFILSNTPGNTDTTLSNIINNNSFIVYYDSSLANVQSINVTVYDDEFKILNLQNNFSFTLSIHEIKDVLKETLVNTKTNNVDTTGHFI